MITDSIENDGTIQPAPEKPKAKFKPRRKPSPQESEAGKDTQAQSRARQQESRSHRADETGKGATLTAIMAATGWQAHTVRAFVSILGKNGGEKIESAKSIDGERTYEIK